MLVVVKKELDIGKLQSRINEKIESSISDAQKEFFLKEQLRTIKKELGLERDEKTSDIEKFRDRLKTRTIPEKTMNSIDEELERLSVLDPQSSEYGVCRSYVDWLTVLPWGIQKKERDKLLRCEQILDKDHFGLDDVKKRIIEIIGVGKLRGQVKGSILLLVGPPGVGKTSVGKSVANALNRPFYRFSVGGMRDEAEIKGHRRTYVGAMPGKMIQAMKMCEANNPVIMIDEVDKIGTHHAGDPASALLEALDPEQNNAFMDHYLDVPFDLSNALFILTANTPDNIPAPLMDRCEQLRLSGYIREEKYSIARKYLIPKNKNEMGMKDFKISITKKALDKLIDDYARESGVRSLEKSIQKILRKAATSHVVASEQNPDKTIEKTLSITHNNLEDYLGKPRFTSEHIYLKPPTGTAIGLAWTSLGGATLYIESCALPAEKPSMKLTGQAGDVMKESSSIAWSYSQKFLSEIKGITAFFNKESVHIHIPEGATPKDGPSAGITMTTSILSLLLKQKNKALYCNDR